MRARVLEYAAPILVMGAYVALTLTLFEPAFRFHGDHERDLRYATLLVEHGIWPDASPAIAPTPFELGPLLYLILAPAVAVSADPVHVRVYFVALSAAALFVIYRVLRRHVGRTATTTALFALASSEFMFEASAQLWHSSLLALPIALFWDALDRLIRAPTGRLACVAAVWAAVALQLHIVAIVYTAGLLAGLVLVSWERPGRPPALKGRHPLVAGAVYLLVLTPFLVTLGRSLSRGAAERAGDSTHGWGPASLGSFGQFCFENLHPIWGDDLGPLLVWPVLGMLALGVLEATRTLFGRLLLMNLGVGALAEILLLGNQMAHRYLHANAWAAFFVVGLGAEASLRRIPKRPRAFVAGGLGALAIAVTVEATLSEVPRAEPVGWLNATLQRSVAQVVATEFPMPESTMEARVHGIYFGEPMGMLHWHLLHAPLEPIEPPAEQHVLVMPGDLGLAPYGTAYGRRWMIRGSGRDVAIQAFRPAFDIPTLSSPAADTLGSRWRRARAEQGPRLGPAVHALSTRAHAAGSGTLALADGRGAGACAVAARVNDTAVRVVPLPAPAYGWIRFLRVEIPEPGALVITLGPCTAPAFLDFF